MVPEGLDARLSLQHEGRIIASQKAPPSPASLRSRNGTSPASTIPTHDPELASKPLVTTLDLPGANPDQEHARAAAIDDPDVAGLRVVASPRRPTFLQQERWKAIQKAMRKGMSLRSDGEGVGDPQSHHQEIQGCRRSSGAAFPACSHCVNIRYSGAITK